MPNIQVRLRRGSATDHDTTSGGFTGAEGEVTVDTTNDTLRVHDGSTAGGIRLAKYSELGAGGSTNLTATATGTSLTITSSTGNDASVPAATTSAWGAMTDEDKTKLDTLTSQTWTNQTSSRALDGTVYTNNTGAAISVHIQIYTSGSQPAPGLVLQVNTGTSGSPVWLTISYLNESLGLDDSRTIVGLIPDGIQYRAGLSNSTNINLTRWVELR